MPRSRRAPAPKQPPAKGRARARRLPPEERRAQLLDSAAAIVGTDGPAAVTMERLAERAAVSKGLGYAYFRDAEGVLLALWDREVDAVYRRVEAGLDRGDSFEAGLAAAFSAYLDVVAERGDLLGRLRARFGSQARPPRPIARRVRAFLAFWAKRIGEATGADRPTAYALAGMMVSAGDAAATSWRAGALTREEVERLCVGFQVGGLRAVVDAAHATRYGERTAR